MQECGGFEINFINNVDMDLVRTSIKEMLDGIEGQLYISENRICLDGDFPITHNDFDGLFEERCKKVGSIQPKSSFNGIAYYSNLSVGWDMHQKSSYRQNKKELVVESVNGVYFDGCCPGCGVKLFAPEECRNQEIYHCNDCDKDFKFDINYGKSLWVLKDGKFKLKNN